MQNDEKEKFQKPQNILRQTLDAKTLFKPKLEKMQSEGETLSQSVNYKDFLQRPTTQTDISYSRRGNYVPETKSLRNIESPSNDQSIQ